MIPALPTAALLLAALALPWAPPASAAQEPFGAPIGAWRITQEAGGGRVVCRAIAAPGENLVGRRGDGKFYVSVPVRGIPAGRYPETSFITGDAVEPIDAWADSQRFVLEIDEHLVGRVVSTGGYQWRAMVQGRLRTGAVMFDRSVGQAVARLRECTRANGGR